MFALTKLLSQLVSGIALASFAASASASEPGADRQKSLRYLVLQDCGSCHGMTLKGGLGNSLLPKDLADSESSALVQIILEGVPGTPMPGWRGLLTEDEVAWIVRGLKEGTIAK